MNRTQKIEERPQLLTTADLSDMLKTSPRTLEAWRVTGEGPRYVKLTARKVRYRLADVLAWIEERTFRHTSEESTSGALSA